VLLVNQAVALVVALACALYLGCRRGFAARNRQYLPTVYAFVFVCVALLAANLQPHLWEELYKVLKHWALAFTGLALAWQAFSLQGFGKGERR
jgi:hypothetical protein